jgi:hypothetical protein
MVASNSVRVASSGTRLAQIGVLYRANGRFESGINLAVGPGSEHQEGNG